MSRGRRMGLTAFLVEEERHGYIDYLEGPYDEPEPVKRKRPGSRGYHYDHRLNEPDPYDQVIPSAHGFDYGHGLHRPPRPPPGMPEQPGLPFRGSPVMSGSFVHDGPHHRPHLPMPPHPPTTMLHGPPNGPLPYVPPGMHGPHPPTQIPPPVPCHPMAPHPHLGPPLIPPPHPGMPTFPVVHQLPPHSDAQLPRPPMPPVVSQMAPPQNVIPPPPIPTDKYQDLTQQNQLPPPPPMPPSEVPKPPPPKEPPPPSPRKSSSSSSSSPPSRNKKSIIEFLESLDSSPEKSDLTKKCEVKNVRQIPSIDVSRSSYQPTPTTNSNRVSSFLRHITPTEVKENAMSPAPSAKHVHKPSASESTDANVEDELFDPGVVIDDEPYDPEKAVFSPPSEGDSLDEYSIESLINKYVRKPKKFSGSESAPISHLLPKSGKKGKTSTNSQNVSLDDSPDKPDLDSRLRMMFGVSSEKKLPSKKAKKKKHSPRSDSDEYANMEELDDDLKPLSPTPSPFLTRHLYLFWHKETIKIRKNSKLTNKDFVNTNSEDKSVKTQTSKSSDANTDEEGSESGKDQSQPSQVPGPGGSAAKADDTQSTQSQLNGQVMISIPPLSDLPPLPKCLLPTVPPPTYKSIYPDLPAPSESNITSFKAESSMKSVERMHPYKTGGEIGYVKNSMDSEFELSCEASPEDGSQDEDCNISGNEVVDLVMTKILKELRKVIRKELTKEIVDRKVDQCLERKKAY